MNVLLAGGAGFLGKDFAIHWLRQHPESRVVVLDTLRRHRSDVALLEGLGDVTVIEGDVADLDLVSGVLRAAAIEVLVNFACDARVERATADPQAAVRSNVASVVSLLEAVRQLPGVRFHQVSSAEVFGARKTPTVAEDAAYAPRTPYGATKAGADHFVRAYHECYGVHTTTSIAPNIFGPYQHPDQVLPRFVTNAIVGAPLPVYGDGQFVREWLHVSDHSRGIAAIVEHGPAGRTYNLGSGETWAVTRLAGAVLDTLEQPRTLIQRLPDRPGHANRPVLDSSRAQRELGWRSWVTLEAGLSRTVEWYVANRSWWSAHSVLAGSVPAGDRPYDGRPERP